MAVFLKVGDLLVNLDAVRAVDLRRSPADAIDRQPFVVFGFATGLGRSVRSGPESDAVRAFFAGTGRFPETQTQDYGTVIDLTPPTAATPTVAMGRPYTRPEFEASQEG